MKKIVSLVAASLLVTSSGVAAADAPVRAAQAIPTAKVKVERKTAAVKKELNVGAGLAPLLIIAGVAVAVGIVAAVSSGDSNG